MPRSSAASLAFKSKGFRLLLVASIGYGFVFVSHVKLSHVCGYVFDLASPPAPFLDRSALLVSEHPLASEQTRSIGRRAPLGSGLAPLCAAHHFSLILAVLLCHVMSCGSTGVVADW